MTRTIHLSAEDNLTRPVTKLLMKSLENAYEVFTGTSEQELANRIYNLMSELEDIRFTEEEAKDDMSTAVVL